VSDKNTLTEYDGSTIRTVPFPLPASFPPLTNLVPGGDRLVAYGPGVRVSFEYHPAARRVFARPEHCDGLQSCVDIAWYPWLAEQLGTSIVSARPSAPSADPATFTVYVNDIAVLPNLEGEPAQLLTDYSERLCHVIWESDGTWHAVISEDGTVYQPATFVSAEAPTDATLYDNGTPTVEITKRPTYDPATKTVNIPYEISCSMSVDSVTVDVEYNEGTGWKPATPASGHPHHSGTTGLQPHAPYVFVHAYAHDLAKPHTSLQYRLTATLA
jgi:hypothetical protein